ncbi:hypothetical protein SAMN05216377_1359 [Pseudonocardia oroxyli]|uniref:Uncharacterized protein n=2 Tax=Pseudonocardia oroxyli TaxID=366584 RepID=A0A1G8EF47_PSEOR|nr:hypothetical protein SAMN05216377_1359 [Pseudonocardia oroxyli]
MSAPANEVPVRLPWSAVLARGEDVAVLLVGARLYSTCMQLDIHVRGRGGAAFDLHMAASGRPDANGDVLCLGLSGAEGFAATNLSRSPSAQPDEVPKLTPGGGGGGFGAVATTYLLRPSPPAGPVTLWCAWPVRGIEETGVEFDGSRLVELAEQVEVLWPLEDETPWSMTPPAPNVPPGGWFATHAPGG